MSCTRDWSLAARLVESVSARSSSEASSPSRWVSAVDTSPMPLMRSVTVACLPSVIPAELERSSWLRRSLLVASMRFVASRVMSKMSWGVVVRCTHSPSAPQSWYGMMRLARGRLLHGLLALVGVPDADVLRAEQRLEGDVGLGAVLDRPRRG